MNLTQEHHKQCYPQNEIRTCVTPFSQNRPCRNPVPIQQGQCPFFGAERLPFGDYCRYIPGVAGINAKFTTFLCNTNVIYLYFMNKRIVVDAGPTPPVR